MRPLASAKTIQDTITRLHVQARQIGAGTVAARAHKRCLSIPEKERRSDEERRRFLTLLQRPQRPRDGWIEGLSSTNRFLLTMKIFSKRLSFEATRSMSSQGTNGWVVPEEEIYHDHIGPRLSVSRISSTINESFL